MSELEDNLKSLQPETQEDRENKVKMEQKEVVDRIIRGVNDVFEKEYELDHTGKKYLVKIKAPNALEVGKIQAKLAVYLGGMNNYQSEYILTAYSTLATIRTTGIDVPEPIKNDEDIYNLDMFYAIGRDFEQWLTSFRY
jgi:hypothetical protein